MAALTQRSDAWSWWHDLGNPQKVLAPMVGASERAFRMLCRRHGCDLAVTPMIHARPVSYTHLTLPTIYSV